MNKLPFDFLPSAPVDMTRTMPPKIPGLNARIRDTLAHVSDLPDLDTIVQRHRFFGSQNERKTAADWLSPRLGFIPDIDQLYLTSGTQACLKILLPRLVGSNNCIATEMMSYAGITQCAQLFGIRVVGVEIDDQGIIPEAFETICQRDRPKALYCNPTIHNPTTSILPAQRRRDIADIARNHGVAIIEDDVHGKLVTDAPPAIAAIAPDITWYLMSVSKCIGMGLRVAFIVAPNVASLTELRASIPSVSSWFVSGISSAIVTRLIDTGGADAIAGEIREEVRERQSMASTVLDGLNFQTKSAALHLWLDLPTNWNVADLVAAVEPQNVIIRRSDLFNAGGVAMPNKLRLSLVAPESRADLRYSLEVLRRTLERN